MEDRSRLTLTLHIVFNTIYVFFRKCNDHLFSLTSANANNACTFTMHIKFCLKVQTIWRLIPNMSYITCTYCLTWSFRNVSFSIFPSISIGRDFYFLLCNFTIWSQSAFLSDFVNLINFKISLGFASRSLQNFIR